MHGQKLNSFKIITKRTANLPMKNTQELQGEFVFSLCKLRYKKANWRKHQEALCKFHSR